MRKNRTKRKKDVPVFRLALVLMRYFRGWWEKAMLAAATRYPPTQVGLWERGEEPVPREALERTADAAGIPRYLLDLLLRGLRSFLVAARGRPRADRVLSELLTVELFPLAGEAVDVILDPLEPEPSEVVGPVAEAEALWVIVERSSWPDRWRLVNEDRRFRSWRLCVRVGNESREAAANDPKEALELARLAVRIAELVPGCKEWRQRLQGLATGWLTNAHRACDDLRASEEALNQAKNLWAAGAPGDPGLLNPAVLPWVEAALRRAQRDFPLAIKRIGEALELDTGELRAKILLTKAKIYETLGDIAASAEALLEAIPLINAAREPRLAWIPEFHLVFHLCSLGRAQEALPRLPKIKQLAINLGELDAARALWLEGLVALGLGEREKARDLFEQVRTAFDKPELSLDWALVSLDLSLVHLEQGNTAAVRAIAEEMYPIFKSQRVHREALAALQVFCEAAKQETATVELARSVSRFLHRAQLDPELVFGG